MDLVAQRQASTAAMLEMSAIEGWHGGPELPFLEGHDGRTLVFEDGLVRVHANQQLLAKLASLQHCAGMAWQRSA